MVSIEDPLNQMVPNAVKHTREEEHEVFIGCNILAQIDLHLPNDVHSVGRCKSTKRGKEINGEKQMEMNKEAKVKVTCLCKTCNQIGFHDSRNCPGKETMNVQHMLPNCQS